MEALNVAQTKDEAVLQDSEVQRDQSRNSQPDYSWITCLSTQKQLAYYSKRHS